MLKKKIKNAFNTCYNYIADNAYILFDDTISESETKAYAKDMLIQDTMYNNGFELINIDLSNSHHERLKSLIIKYIEKL